MPRNDEINAYDEFTRTSGRLMKRCSNTTPPSRNIEVAEVSPLSPQAHANLAWSIASLLEQRFPSWRRRSVATRTLLKFSQPMPSG